MDTIKIVNTKQAMLYIKHGVKPVDLFEDRGVIIYIFDKKKTKELYDSWCKYELR